MSPRGVAGKDIRAGNPAEDAPDMSARSVLTRAQSVLKGSPSGAPYRTLLLAKHCGFQAGERPHNPSHRHKAPQTLELNVRL